MQKHVEKMHIPFIPKKKKNLSLHKVFSVHISRVNTNIVKEEKIEILR